MAEPTTTTAAIPVGFMALLMGALGPVAADVMLVVISAMAGCFIALSAMSTRTLSQSVGFLMLGIVVSLVLAWALTGLVTGWVPSLSGPYLPSIIALFIGFLSNRLPGIFNAIMRKVEGKAGISVE